MPLETSKETLSLPPPGSIVDLRKAVIVRFEGEFKQLDTRRQQLETKAQGAIAVAGIYTAGLLATARGFDLKTTAMEKNMLAVGLLFLILTVLSALRALWLRRIPTAPSGEKLLRQTEHLLSTWDKRDNPESIMLNDVIMSWQTPNRRMKKIIETKALYVLGSHFFAAASIVCGAIAIYHSIQS